MCAKPNNYDPKPHKVCLVLLDGAVKSGKTTIYKSITKPDLTKGRPLFSSHTLFKDPSGPEHRYIHLWDRDDSYYHREELKKSSYHTPIGFILVYAMNDKNSLQETFDIFKNELLLYFSSNFVFKVYLVGTHCDLIDERKVSEYHIQHTLDQINDELRDFTFQNKVNANHLKLSSVQEKTKDKHQEVITPPLGEAHTVKTFQISSTDTFAVDQLWKTVREDIWTSNEPTNDENGDVDHQMHADVDFEQDNKVGEKKKRCTIV